MSDELSLLDTADRKVRDWYVVFFHREAHYWFTKFLKPGFRHVELTKPQQYGPDLKDVVWLHVLPTFEMLDAEVQFDPTPPWVRVPGATICKVTASRRLATIRSWFDIGPPSCVEIIKAALGIRAFWVRTPFQLYKYIRKRNGILTN